jgi:hypothetical protein
MAPMLVVVVVALAFVFLEGAAAAPGTDGRSPSVQRRQVQSLLRRLNKTPAASIEVLYIGRRPAHIYM